MDKMEPCDDQSCLTRNFATATVSTRELAFVRTVLVHLQRAHLSSHQLNVAWHASSNSLMHFSKLTMCFRRGPILPRQEPLRKRIIRGFSLASLRHQLATFLSLSLFCHLKADCIPLLVQKISSAFPLSIKYTI